MTEDRFHVLDFVDDYFHEVVTPDYAAYLEQHCERCAMCKVALEEARKRHAALETLPTVEASEELIRSTVTRIEQEDRRRRSRRRLFSWTVLPALAASVLILLGLNIYYARMAPSPYSLVVLGQNQLYAAANGSLRIRVINHATGAALAGVPVQVELRDRPSGRNVQLARFTTNAQGTGQPFFALPDWADGDYELRVTAKTRSGDEELTRSIKLKRAWRLMLGSDKPVYQPGQTIHLRCLALRKPNLKPFAGETAVFTIADPKGNIIFKQKDPTSKFGIASADCALANEILEGPYTVECKIGDTESRMRIEVKKYVLPKFKIDVKGLEPYYQPGQRVKGTVQVDYFFGKPVANGEVKIRVHTTDVGRNDLRELTARTDDKGAAEFEFRLPGSLVGRPQDSGDARFGLEILVTDAAGQKQSKVVTRTVAAQPIKLEVIPEGGSLVRSEPNTIYLYASYPDGRPAKVWVTVSGVDREIPANEMGVASFTYRPIKNSKNMEPARQVEFILQARDDQGRTGRRQVIVPFGQAGQDFIIRTDKAVYNGGETVHLTALGSGVEPVFVDFIKDGQTLFTESIGMANGKGEYQFDLPPEVFGTIEVVAYRFGKEGLPVRKSRVIYVRQASQVKIAATLDKKEYRPGKKAVLEFALTDKDGKPAPGALSVAAVDEAVYSVMEQAPGMERTFYLLEQELLKPVYAIYPWSPDLTSSTPPADRIELEQAIFSTTAMTEEEAQPRSKERAASEPMPSPREESKRMPVDREGTPLGSKVTSRFSLSGASFPIKVVQTREARETGLKRVWTAWIVLGIVVALGVVPILLWLIERPLTWSNSRQTEPGCEQFFEPGPAGIPAALRSDPPSKSSGSWMSWLFLFGCIIVVSLAAITTIGSQAHKTFQTVGNSLQWGAPMASDQPAAERNMVRTPEPKPESEKKDEPKEDDGPNQEQAGAGSLRVREWFPETLLWRPQLVTDDQGRYRLEIDLADSITTWRVTSSAITTEGRLGAEQAAIRVFQPFFVDLNLPVALTRGDEVAVPVVVYNYLDKPQTVELSLADAGWFERLDDAKKTIELRPREVKSIHYRLGVRKVGKHTLEVQALAGGVGDAIKKEIEVVPDGQRIERVFNGSLQKRAELSLNVPGNAIEGSPKAILKIYPSNFSQLVEGLDNIFQMPYGCFEQTSSTTYPNVLALDYLKRTGKKSPQVDAKARQYIHLGYQRLVSFEVRGGGFDWFGRPPANRTLTAYGLMEFQDMAKVHDVDPDLIERTRRWLVRQRLADGSWLPEGHEMHGGPGRDSTLAQLSTTAYIAWAVFSGWKGDGFAAVTKDYLLRHRPNSIGDPYVLALISNALLALDPKGLSAGPYLERLDALKRSSEGGKQAWWEQAANGFTTFYGSGRSGSVETTALAALALMQAGQYPATTRGALNWLIGQKDSRGTWYSTQATVLALKALVTATDKPLGGEKERRIEITWSKGKRQIVIPADQTEVMRQIDLSAELTPGDHRLALSELSGTGVGYQLAFRYHVPGNGQPEKQEPLQITIDYDKTELAVGDTVTANVTVINRMTETAPMIILDLPIPAGFTIGRDQLAELQGSGRIAKFQITARKAIVYLRSLEPGKPLTLRYDLRATMPVKVAVPAGRAYEYYNPDKQGHAAPARMTVTARK